MRQIILFLVKKINKFVDNEIMKTKIYFIKAENRKSAKIAQKNRKVNLNLVRNIRSSIELSGSIRGKVMAHKTYTYTRLSNTNDKSYQKKNARQHFFLYFSTVFFHKVE